MEYRLGINYGAAKELTKEYYCTGTDTTQSVFKVYAVSFHIQALTCDDLPSLISCVTALLAARGPPLSDLSGDACNSFTKTSVNCLIRWSIRALQHQIKTSTIK